MAGRAEPQQLTRVPYGQSRLGRGPRSLGARPDSLCVVTELERDLAAYYDQDAQRRAGAQLDPERVGRRLEFTALLGREGRARLIEVGCGPGVDAEAFQEQGLSVTGVDLSLQHVMLCRAQGLDAHVASVQSLPFVDDAFDAAWTMSTLLHVPNAALGDALVELRRVLVAGAPLAIGLWSGDDTEGPSRFDVDPPRFFSFRSDTRVRELLGQFGEIERFDTWETPGADGPATYQWCVLRLPQ